MRGSCGVPGFAAVSPIFSPTPPRSCPQGLPPAPQHVVHGSPPLPACNRELPLGQIAQACHGLLAARCQLEADAASVSLQDLQNRQNLMSSMFGISWKVTRFFQACHMPGLFPRMNFTDLPLGHESYRNFMGLVELNGGTKITFPFTATSSLPYIFPNYSP